MDLSLAGNVMLFLELVSSEQVCESRSVSNSFAQSPSSLYDGNRISSSSALHCSSNERLLDGVDVYDG